jgi:hypothetical protein
VSPASDPVFANIPTAEEQMGFFSTSATYNSMQKEEDDDEDDTPDWFLQSM